MNMVTLIDRLFRKPFRLAKYTGEHLFVDEIKHLEKDISVEITWYYHHSNNSFDISTVCEVGSSKDIWDDLVMRNHGRIKQTIKDRFVDKWSNEAGIAHKYDYDVLYNPYTKKW